MSNLVLESHDARSASGGGMLARLPVPLLPLQPVLYRIVRHVARAHPELIERLGPHRRTSFLIDPVDLPFALHLVPDPKRLVLRAVYRRSLPAHGARISGSFLTLLSLIDADEDGDAVFFSRDLVISGDTEAIVTLRNALDDIDGSIAGEVAAMFGPPGKFALARIQERIARRSDA
ncbi:ubiquinone anaerobic biosynthesis accessory factor UbiT [Tropicimonas sp.]|uniref:ubiquinone anaerobic biosynthesis accessory factor UbiT n=1 Tax=Tropicimonas sp. TaxID=2067044 RepID=UPI003A8A45FE